VQADHRRWAGTFRETWVRHQDQERGLGKRPMNDAPAVYSFGDPGLLGCAYACLEGTRPYYRLGLQSLDRRGRDEAVHLPNGALEVWKAGLLDLAKRWQTRNRKVWMERRTLQDRIGKKKGKEQMETLVALLYSATGAAYVLRKKAHNGLSFL
jgi:hypothetical protein